jgi:cytochrome c5
VRRLGLLTAVIGVATMVGHPPRSVADSRVRIEPTRTVWDSVYTDSQAARGDTLYKAQCGKCHSANLSGGDEGPALNTAVFLSNWDGHTLADLTDRIRNSMPPENPNSIPRDQVVDILAHMLAQNHFPSGRTALTDDASRLKDIKFLQSKP